MPIQNYVITDTQEQWILFQAFTDTNGNAQDLIIGLKTLQSIWVEKHSET